MSLSEVTVLKLCGADAAQTYQSLSSFFNEGTLDEPGLATYGAGCVHLRRTAGRLTDKSRIILI